MAAKKRQMRSLNEQNLADLVGLLRLVRPTKRLLAAATAEYLKQDDRYGPRYRKASGAFATIPPVQ